MSHPENSVRPARSRDVVEAAEKGSAAWASVVQLQRWDFNPHHADFYALAGEIVSTVGRLDELVEILRAQVADYVRTPGLYDDTREVDPLERIRGAVDALATAGDALATADDAVNVFWSAIGHVGVEEAL